MSAVVAEEAQKLNMAVFSSEFAAHMDKSDPLASFRSEFLFPKAPAGSDREEVIYLCGTVYICMLFRLFYFKTL